MSRLLSLLFLIPLSLGAQVSYHLSNPLGEIYDEMAVAKEIPLPTWFLKIIPSEEGQIELLYQNGRIVKGKIQTESALETLEPELNEDKYTFRPNGTLRSISIGDDSLRLGNDNWQWSDKDSRIQWTWEGSSSRGQRRNPAGTLLSSESRAFFSVGSLRRTTSSEGKTLEQVYSPLGVLIAQQIHQDGKFISRDNWQYNEAGNLIAWTHTSPEREETRTYRWLGDTLTHETLKEDGQILQTTEYKKEGRQIERFSRSGESLGSFWIPEETP